GTMLRDTSTPVPHTDRAYVADTSASRVGVIRRPLRFLGVEGVRYRSDGDPVDDRGLVSLEVVRSRPGLGRVRDAVPVGGLLGPEGGGVLPALQVQHHGALPEVVLVERGHEHLPLRLTAVDGDVGVPGYRVRVVVRLVDLLRVGEPDHDRVRAGVGGIDGERQRRVVTGFAADARDRLPTLREGEVDGPRCTAELGVLGLVVGAGQHAGADGAVVDRLTIGTGGDHHLVDAAGQ